MTSVPNGQPDHKAIPKRACGAVDRYKAPPRNFECPGGQQERGKRNGRGKDGGKENGKDGVALGPLFGPIEVALGDVTIQCGLAALKADAPGDVAAREAARNGTKGK